MTELEKHRLKVKLHEKVNNIITLCADCGDEEDFRSALKYAIHLLTSELFYNNKKENKNDYLR